MPAFFIGITNDMESFSRHIIDKPEDFLLLTDAVKKQMTTAAINTVNIEAAYARKNLVEKAGTTFTLRNTFTVKNCTFEQMRMKPVKSLNEIRSRVGFSEKVDYMRRQDEGGYHTSKTGSKLAIPTDKARAGKNKQRLVGKQYRLSEIMANKIRGPIRNKIVLRSSSRKARSVARAIVASGKNFDGKKKFVHYGKNIFRITHFKRKGILSRFGKICCMLWIDRKHVQSLPDFSYRNVNALCKRCKAFLIRKWIRLLKDKIYNLFCKKLLTRYR